MLMCRSVNIQPLLAEALHRVDLCTAQLDQLRSAQTSAAAASADSVADQTEIQPAGDTPLAADSGSAAESHYGREGIVDASVHQMNESDDTVSAESKAAQALTDTADIARLKLARLHAQRWVCALERAQMPDAQRRQTECAAAGPAEGAWALTQLQRGSAGVVHEAELTLLQRKAAAVPDTGDVALVAAEPGKAVELGKGADQ
jgi:hypothetical protein